jgi:beta-N-acetylhexosaminidase
MLRPRAAIVGLSGTVLTEAEVALFRAAPPLGIILFARNVADPPQLRALTTAIRELLGEVTPILVDQEGGRVARLRPPHWPEFPAAARFEQLPEEAARANAALLGLCCRDAGFDVVCAPVLDLRLPGAHGIIGDRAFSESPAEVARQGLAWAEGLQQAGCIPVVKHIPGHGRAMVDSHFELPRVAAPRDVLAEDCGSFAALAGLAGWAMTAHIVYEALDAERPATLSPIVIGQVIRRAIGFQGILVSDDLCMKALQGEPGALAQQSIAAGCDMVLHCNGVLADTAALLEGCPPLTESAAARLAETRAQVQAISRPLDSGTLLAVRDAQLAAAA